MEYLEAHSQESHGEHSFGLKILVAVKRPLTEKDKEVCWKIGDDLMEALRAETNRLDPKETERAALERAGIVACFSEPIFVEEIHNGYCSRSCCVHLPWFIITTKIGRIKIGWRKRVINIDWSDSLVTTKAAELFPDADVTKFDRTIHAWSLEKAKAYIDNVMKTGEREPLEPTE